MPHRVHDRDEVVRRGEEIYRRDLRARVEPEHVGKFLAIDVDTGDYEIDADDRAALDRSRAKHPDGERYLMRIGYSAAYSFGGCSRTVET